MAELLKVLDGNTIPLLIRVYKKVEGNNREALPLDEVKNLKLRLVRREDNYVVDLVPHLRNVNEIYVRLFDQTPPPPRPRTPQAPLFRGDVMPPVPEDGPPIPFRNIFPPERVNGYKDSVRGTWGIELSGVYGTYRMRSLELRRIRVVHHNAEGNVTFTEIDGEDVVPIDMTIQLFSGAAYIVDDEILENSENPVAGGTIYEAMQRHRETLQDAVDEAVELMDTMDAGETARATAEQLRKNAETAREGAEAQRAANEVARQSAFETSEAARQTAFQASEAGRTTTFQASEAARQTAFQTSEAGRQSTFNTNEAERQAAIDNKLDQIEAMEFDEKPTPDSGKAVKSGGLYKVTTENLKMMTDEVTLERSSSLSESVTINTTTGVIESGSSTDKIRYITEKLKKGTIIHFSWPVTSQLTSSYGVRWGFTEQDPGAYIEENNNSIIGLVLDNLSVHYHNNNLINEYELVVPYDGYAVYRYYSPTSNSRWGTSVCTGWKADGLKNKLEGLTDKDIELTEEINEIGVKNEVTLMPDFVISDEENNDIVRFEDGHVKTKNFDSREVSNIQERVTELDVASDSVDSALELNISRVKDSINPTKVTSASGTDLINDTITGYSFYPSQNPCVVTNQYEGGTSLDSNYKLRYFTKQYKRGTIIHFKLITANTYNISYGFSPTDPADYIEEHGSILGFPITNPVLHQYVQNGSNYEHIFDVEMPFDGWLVFRYYSNGSTWSNFAFFVYEVNGKIGETGIDNEVLYDFAVTDESDNVIMGLSGGHVKTKNFDSEKLQGDLERKKPKPYQRVTRFTVKVNGIQPQGSDFVSTGKGVFKDLPSDFGSTNYTKVTQFTDYAALYLPTTYTQDGTPTRLVMFGKQGGSKVTSGSDPLFGSNYLNISRYLLSLGYALLIVDGTPDAWASTLDGGRGVLDGYQNGNYIAVQSARKAYDYVVENYNIDKTGVFGWGYSQGGWMIMNIAELSGIPFLAVCLKSPVVTLKGHWNSTTSLKYNNTTLNGHKFRYLMTKVYGIADELAITNNWNASEVDDKLINDTDGCLSDLEYDTWKYKWAGYDPFTRYAFNVEETPTNFDFTGDHPFTSTTMIRPNKFPVKIWVCKGDTVVGYKVQSVLIQAMRNAGCVADIHVYNGGDHYMSPSFFYNTTASTPYDYRIGKFTDNGTDYSLYPPTYEMALWFQQHGGLPISYSAIDGSEEQDSDDNEENITEA